MNVEVLRVNDDGDDDDDYYDDDCEYEDDLKMKREICMI